MSAMKSGEAHRVCGTGSCVQTFWVGVGEKQFCVPYNVPQEGTPHAHGGRLRRGGAYFGTLARHCIVLYPQRAWGVHEHCKPQRTDITQNLLGSCAGRTVGTVVITVGHVSFSPSPLHTCTNVPTYAFKPLANHQNNMFDHSYDVN